ncbi:MAG TPA: DNA ligase D [Polyangiaceae bacterium]|nr:DNA ligase D [Polyangiaceae bacterium]
MALEKYRQKRNFTKTAEPPGKSTAKGGNSFVVQKHAARALHYDFRLELDGVLLSWAVPKGPSLDPKVKRLAMQVEDHPVAYGGFEGSIPGGEYGAGNVIVWDRGTWEPEGDPHEALEKGRLNFKLDGEKLHGSFHLVRTGRSNPKKPAWLLFKATDDEARSGDDAEIVETRPESVISGRRIEDAATRPAAKKKVTVGAAAKKKTAPRAAKSTTSTTKKRTSAKTAARRTATSRPAALPAFFEPELATLVDAAPPGDDYLHEIKLDGYRILARIEDGRVTLLSRRGNDWSSRLPSIVKALEALALDGSVLDGEVVVFGESGVSNFQRLQNSMEAGKDSACQYVVFDAPFLDGEDRRKLPLVERKTALADRLTKKALGKGPIRLSEHVVGNGPRFFEESCRLGLEGIVSKRVDAPYVSRRDKAWLKVKCTSEQEFVIGGFTEPAGSRGHFGALLLGVHEKDGLEYVGKVGTGFSARSLTELSKQLKKLARKDSPFNVPLKGADARGVHYVEPMLVAQVKFAERTEDGILRHASFLGLREDKAPHDVHDEKATKAPTKPTRATKGEGALPDGVELTHPDRVLYAAQGITKRDLAEYYSKVAKWMLPHVAGRPLTLVRCPEGVGKQCFFQKHPSQNMPDAIGTVPITEKKGKQLYMVVHDAAGLVDLVQLGALELHTWGSQETAVEKPDQLVFDFDPDVGLEWERMVEAVTELRKALDGIGLTGFLKTTGGKGLHVVVPVKPELEWDAAKAFTKSVVEAMAKNSPRRYLTTMTKEKRKGKIFLDYLRNGRGATAVCAYSTRAREGAPVSTPIAWAELESGLRPETLDTRSVPARLAKLAKDPWKGFDDARASISRFKV